MQVPVEMEPEYTAFRYCSA